MGRCIRADGFERASQGCDRPNGSLAPEIAKNVARVRILLQNRAQAGFVGIVRRRRGYRPLRLSQEKVSIFATGTPHMEADRIEKQAALLKAGTKFT